MTKASLKLLKDTLIAKSRASVIANWKVVAAVPALFMALRMVYLVSGEADWVDENENRLLRLLGLIVVAAAAALIARKVPKTWGVVGVAAGSLFLCNYFGGTDVQIYGVIGVAITGAVYYYEWRRDRSATLTPRVVTPIADPNAATSQGTPAGSSTVHSTTGSTAVQSPAQDPAHTAPSAQTGILGLGGPVSFAPVDPASVTPLAPATPTVDPNAASQAAPPPAPATPIVDPNAASQAAPPPAPATPTVDPNAASQAAPPPAPATAKRRTSRPPKGFRTWRDANEAAHTAGFADFKSWNQAGRPTVAPVTVAVDNNAGEPETPAVPPTAAVDNNAGEPETPAVPPTAAVDNNAGEPETPAVPPTAAVDNNAGEPETPAVPPTAAVDNNAGEPETPTVPPIAVAVVNRTPVSAHDAVAALQGKLGK